TCTAPLSPHAPHRTPPADTNLARTGYGPPRYGTMPSAARSSGEHLQQGRVLLRAFAPFSGLFRDPRFALRFRASAPPRFRASAYRVSAPPCSRTYSKESEFGPV